MTWWHSLSADEQLAVFAGAVTVAAILLDIAFGQWPTRWFHTIGDGQSESTDADEERRREELSAAATFSQASWSTPAAKGFQRRTEPRERSRS